MRDSSGGVAERDSHSRPGAIDVYGPSLGGRSNLSPERATWRVAMVEDARLGGVQQVPGRRFS
jgi:hypothetical protein